MTEPTNHYTQLTPEQRTRLYAWHREAMQFARYACAAGIIDAAEKRMGELAALPEGGFIALDADEANVLGLTRMAA